MAFATPWFLLGLLGIGIPIAIHLIRRQRIERVVLPTVRFLKPAPRKHIYFQQIKRWLLLALRVAIVGLLAVAFARPLLTGAYPRVAGRSPKSVVILLDASMSMQYAGRFNQGKKAAIDIIDSLNVGDEAGVALFAEGPGLMQALTTDHKAAAAFVHGISNAGYGATDFGTALRLADQALQAARHQEKAVYLISDFQKNAVPAESEALKLSAGVRFDIVDVGQADAANLAVIDGYLVQQTENYSFVGHVKNFGDLPLETVRLSLTIDGTQRASRTASLPGNSEIRVEFPFTIERVGTYRGALTVSGDRFEPDNTYHFVVKAAPVLRVLCVSGGTALPKNEEQTYWFESALSQKTRTPFHVDVVDPALLTLDVLASYAVVALFDPDRLAPQQVQALQAYVKGGGGLLIAAAGRVDGNFFNRQYRDLTPALLQRKIVLGDDAAEGFAQAHPQHPLIRTLQVDGRTDFGMVRFYGYWEAEPVAAGQVVMRFENGRPALIAREIDNGRVLLFTSSLDPQWNNFPLQVTYLPLMHEAVRYLAGSRDQQVSYRIGDFVPVAVTSQRGARVISPEGQEFLIRSGPSGYAIFQATGVPGPYETRSGNVPDRFAVNVPARESDFSYRSPEHLRKRLAASRTPEVPAAAERASFSPSGLENQYQLWWWLLLLVFAMSLMETYLANRTDR